MAQSNLDVENAGDHMTDHEKNESIAARRHAFIHNAVTEAGPKEDLASKEQT